MLLVQAPTYRLLTDEVTPKIPGNYSGVFLVPYLAAVHEERNLHQVQDADKESCLTSALLGVAAKTCASLRQLAVKKMPSGTLLCTFQDFFCTVTCELVGGTSLVN